MKKILLLILFAASSVRADYTVNDLVNFFLFYAGQESSSIPSNYQYTGLSVATPNGPIDVRGTVSMSTETGQNVVALASGSEIITKFSNAGNDNKVKLDDAFNKIAIAQDGTKNNVKTINGSETRVNNTMADAVWVRWEDCKMDVKICQELYDEPLRVKMEAESYAQIGLVPAHESLTGDNFSGQEIQDRVSQIADGVSLLGVNDFESAPTLGSSATSPAIALTGRLSGKSFVFDWTPFASVVSTFRAFCAILVGCAFVVTARATIADALTHHKMSQEARTIKTPTVLSV